MTVNDSCNTFGKLNRFPEFSMKHQHHHELWKTITVLLFILHMMSSWHGSPFRITGPFWEGNPCVTNGFSSLRASSTKLLNHWGKKTKTTHWCRDKTDTILQTFSNAISWMKMFEFRLKFHWSLFLKVKSTIFQHWFWSWLGAKQRTSHHLNQWWPSSTTHLCVTRPHWVNWTSCSGNNKVEHCNSKGVIQIVLEFGMYTGSDSALSWI